MCCCDCQLVIALRDAALTPVDHRLDLAEFGGRSTGRGGSLSTERIPHRLCGWLSLGLLGRRTHRAEIIRP